MLGKQTRGYARKFPDVTRPCPSTQSRKERRKRRKGEAVGAHVMRKETSNRVTKRRMEKVTERNTTMGGSKGKAL